MSRTDTRDDSDGLINPRLQIERMLLDTIYRAYENIRAIRGDHVPNLPQGRRRVAEGSVIVKPKAFWVPPVVAIAVILLLAGLAIWALGRPAPKNVDLTVKCPSFQLPLGLALDLTSLPADQRLQTVEMREFKGDWDGITQLDIRGTTPGSHAAGPTTRVVLLPDPGRPSPVCTVSVQQQHPGPMNLLVSEGTNWTPTPCESDGPVTLRVTSSEAQDTVLVLNMDIVKAEVHRLLVEGPPWAERLRGQDDLTVTATGDGRDFIRARFEALEPTGSNRSRHPRADLAFARGGTSKPLVLISGDDENSATTRLDVGARTVRWDQFYGLALSLDAVDFQSKDKKIRNFGDHLVIDFEKFSLKEVAVTSPDCALQIKGEGRAHSVKLDGQQLIPTMLSEILDKPDSEKGLWGLAGVFCISVATVFLKQALEVLAKMWIPEQKNQTGGAS